MPTKSSFSVRLSNRLSSLDQRRIHCLLRCGLLLISVFAFSTSSTLGRDQQLPSGLYVDAYCSELSVKPGDTVAVHISSSAETASILVERVGKERNEVMSEEAVAVEQHPIPDRASSDGCNWPASFELPIPADWKSGYYEVTVSVKGSEKEASSKAFFVVRSSQPGSTSKVLLQLSTNTYNAYTNWGGHSLYSFHDRDGLQGHQVSFRRPLRSQFYNWEHSFVVWAETEGFELEYATNNDLEERPELLDAYNLVLSVGHDEYWSAPMRDSLEAFIRNGGNVAFFSGNTCCWQVRNDLQAGTMTCYKQWFNIDPEYRTTDHKTLSTAWSHHLIGRPENELTGVGFLWGGYHRSHGQFMEGSGAFQVHRPDHWIFKGTELKSGDEFGGPESIVGYECDGCEIEWRDGIPFPTNRDGTPEGFEILGTCPAKWHPGDCYWYDRFPKDRVGNAVMGIYTNGGTVFTAGSTDWAHGLRGKTPEVEQITRNILVQLSKRSQTTAK